MKNSTLKKTAYNIFFGIFGQIVTLAIGLVLPRLRIASFGSEVNGLLSSASQIYTYLALLEAGVGSATVQALYKPVATENKDDINAILSATNSYYKKTGMVYLICVLLFAGIYPLVVKTDIDWWVIVAVILLNGLGNVLSYFFQGKYKLLLQVEGKQYIITNMATFVSVASGVFKIILIGLGCGVIALQAVYFIFNIVQVLYFAIYIHRKYKWIDLRVRPNFTSISQKNSALIHQLTQLVFYNTDALILTAFCNLETVSIYAVYTMITDIVVTLIQNINNGISFKLGQLYNSQKELFIKLYATYERYYTALSFALYSVTYVCMAPFIDLYTEGLDINYSLKYLPILFIGIKLLVSGRSPSGQLASWAGHFKQTQNRAIVEMVINLTVSLILVQFIGIYGVLIGTVAALLYRANDMIIYANKYLLNRSSFMTYKFWIIDLMIFAVVMFVNAKLNLTISNYIDFFILGIVSGISICILYFIVTFVCSYKETILFLKLFSKNKNK